MEFEKFNGLENFLLKKWQTGPPQSATFSIFSKIIRHDTPIQIPPSHTNTLGDLLYKCAIHRTSEHGINVLIKRKYTHLF